MKKSSGGMRPTSIVLSRTSLAELRELALRQSLRSGLQVTTSSIVRQCVEEFLAGRVRADDVSNYSEEEVGADR